MINNKKGFLLGEETVKLILAVIAILFLILFIVFLYNNFSKNKELEQAKASLDYLVTQIDSGAANAEIFNPAKSLTKSWLISSFQSPNLPNKCSTVGWQSCICICIKPGGAVHTPAVACDTTGICQETNFIVNGGEDLFGIGTNDIEILNPPLILLINQENKTIQEAVESGA